MKQAENCTAQQIPATPGANHFSLDSVLLVGECECDVVGAFEDGKGVKEGVEEMVVASEGDVTEAERG